MITVVVLKMEQFGLQCSSGLLCIVRQIHASVVHPDQTSLWEKSGLN